ncbi:MT-A70 family methyltransferase [Methylobrevis pamukkalensis]|uniref:Uncharacterized protein n=1 Tax=Methylobrevis pamukkalensis TaxID=1439726 RepID=A0A1E3H4W6_9HYPH|nr:MT-A70 family methyltransferase [Methylobrevis pamukkalensis]ODN71195.1 hypothetical protein A6302_01484 [Methylobrevis pamukkalensis]
MWSTWPHLPMAIETVKAWGFRYVTGGSWHKTTAAGKTCFGTGYVLRSASEPFLVGAIGAPKIVSRSERGVILTEALEEIPSHLEGVRREHSRKPPAMRAMLERLRPQAFGCELFGREPWPGFEVWGDEADKFEGGQKPARRSRRPLTRPSGTLSREGEGPCRRHPTCSGRTCPGRTGLEVRHERVLASGGRDAAGHSR